MSVLYVTEERTTLHLDAETLVLKTPAQPQAGREARKRRVPLGKISQVVIYGNVTVTAPALQALMSQKCDISYLSSYGKFIARVSGDDHKHAQLRLMQGRAHDHPSTALSIARVCVRAKLHNQRTLLLRNNRQREDAQIAQAAERIRALIEAVDALPEQDKSPADPSKPQADTILGKLQGLEGAAAAAYFQGFGRLLVGEWEGGFRGRFKRPPTDPVNALLSYGYTILTTQAVAAAQIVGFDPYIGYLHSTQYGKPALALDIIEMFRAPIVDSVVLSLLNNRVLGPQDFETTMGACRMSDTARKTFLQKLEERLLEEITHPVFKTRASYRRSIEMQMRLLARWLQGEFKQFRGFHIR